MAIYKGRSVQIISVAPITEPNLTVAHKDGTTVVVKPSELLFTRVELDRITKDYQTRYAFDSKNPNPNYRMIEDKDHQELLDGQDEVKMTKKMKEHPPQEDEVHIPAQTIKATKPVISAPSKVAPNAPGR